MSRGLLNQAEVARAAAILKAGGLVAFPTETVYGLGGLALDPAALARIFAAKGRPATHPLIAHVLDAAAAQALASRWPPVAARLAEAFWPGPLTLVVPRAACVPLGLTGGGDSVGIRAPSHEVARALLEAVGAPVAAPSANRYQTLSPTTAAHVAASLGDRVDMILDGGPCSAGIESTVVDVQGPVPLVLRPGAIDLTALALVVPELGELRDAPALAPRDDAPHPSPGLDRRHYAPRTPLFVASSRAALLASAQERQESGERVGLLLMERLSPEDDGTPPFERRALGTEPKAYARELFGALHELDACGVDAILVEAVPATNAWQAVADRLWRGGDPL